MSARLSKVIFSLSMPGKGSWNGKWTGEGRGYYIIRSLSKEDLDRLKITDEPSYFYYNWPDGWGACVTVWKSDAREAAKYKKASVGFCRYDWMVDTIIKYGEIKIERFFTTCPECNERIQVHVHCVSEWCPKCKKMEPVGEVVIECS